VPKDPVTAISVELEAPAIMCFATLCVARHSVVDERCVQFADRLGRQQLLTIELALARCSSIQFAKSATEVLIAWRRSGSGDE
jgi:hypothetical protein